MGTLIALTEGERLGLIGLLGICVTAAASIVGAVLSARVRRENSSQHSESQRLLADLSVDVRDHGRKVDDLRADVTELKTDIHNVGQRVDHAHERIDRHGYQPGL